MITKYSGGFKMPKIVLIGVGSDVFGRDIISDLLLYPALGGSTLSLMDIDKERLDVFTAYAKKLIQQQKSNLKIESTTDRREALDGADYVITSIRSGGWPVHIKDREITMKRGLEIQSDAMGVGGVFSGLRHIPDILDICHDMEEVCPDAWLLNYSNPMAMICWAINDYSKIKNVGLCPNPTGGSERFGRMAGVPAEDVWYTVGGLNHQSWFLEILYKGQDLYPVLRKKVKEMELSDEHEASPGRESPVEIEMFNTFGYFSSGFGHLSISLPYFRRKPELMERYKLSDESRDHVPPLIEKLTEDMRKAIKSGKKFELAPHRYTVIAVSVINAIETNKQIRIFGNVKNTGLIPNLLEGCVVEVPCMIDKGGVHPTYIGNLPPQLAALNRLNINVQELAVRGIVEKDKNKVLQSLLLDPLTFSMLSIDEIKEMVDELFKVEIKKFLKGYK
jgi:alpha-galactosidase